MSIWNIGDFNTGSHGWIEPGSLYNVSPNTDMGREGINTNPGASPYAFDPNINLNPSGTTNSFDLLFRGGTPMHGGLNLSGIASGMQNQASGGFNTIPGMAVGGSYGTSGFSDFSGLFSAGNNFAANGTTTQNPFSLFGGGSTLQGQGSSIPGFNTGSFPGLPPVSAKDLDKIYGKGVGSALSAFLSSGAGFNPSVIQAQINAALPAEQRGIANIMNALGARGLSTSSTAAIGLGDFESQFNAQLQSIFANEYEQSVQNYLNVLMGVKGDARDSKAQETNWMSIAGEIAGSIIPFFA